MELPVDQVRRWQWCLLGVAIGFAMSYAHLGPGDDQGAMTMSRAEFEGKLRSGQRRLLAPVTDLIVYPPNRNTQVITGRQLLPEHGAEEEPRYFPFMVRAPYPYPRDGRSPARADYSVRDYLNDSLLAIGSPPRRAEYTYAWWSEPRTVVAMWTAGSVAVVGGAWPTIIAILTAAGYGRKSLAKEYDLNRFQPESASSTSNSDAKASQEELDAALAAAMTSGETEQSEATTTSVPPVVAPGPLSVDTEAPASALPAAPKHYGGDFYPTTVHADNDG